MANEGVVVRPIGATAGDAVPTRASAERIHGSMRTRRVKLTVAFMAGKSIWPEPIRGIFHACSLIKHGLLSAGHVWNLSGKPRTVASFAT
jgi:hypothetical protein